MITPDPATAPAAPGGRSVKLPLSSLALDGASPTEGDQVSVTVGGRVTAVNGDEATLEIESVDGEPLPAAEASEMTDDDVLAEAERADRDI